MNWNKSQTYWLENPGYGTYKARLCVVSKNEQSLGFELEDPIALRCSNPDLGIAVGKALLIMNHDGVLFDVLSGSVWTVYTTEPERKLATK